MNIKEFLQKENKYLSKKHKETTEASWLLNLTSKKKYEEQLVKIELEMSCHSKKIFKQIKDYDGKGSKLQQRQIKLLHDSSLAEQIPEELDKQILELETKAESHFNKYRAKIDGKKVTDNEIKDILRDETNYKKRRKAWEASKQIGKKVEKDLIKLVRLRNKAAREIGYANYYEMAFNLHELDIKEVFKTFKKLKELTDRPYKKYKKKLDESLRKKYKVKKIMPWAYSDPFFQKMPRNEKINLTPHLTNKNLVEIAEEFYKRLNLDITDLLKKSDLYPKKGKCQHAFCCNMNREGDVRVLLNIENDESWLSTLMHELGHAAYSKYVSKKLPFLLRNKAHILTTEAVAMYMEGVLDEETFLKEYLKIDNAGPLSKKRKKEEVHKRLIFTRWVLTFCYFEKELYENPEQNLRKLWWDKVEEIQLIKRPREDQPDWAAKIHFTIAPVYYQDYLLGYLMTSQIRHHIKKNHNEQDGINKDTGKFLKKHIFEPGNKHHWQEMIKKAFGEKLNEKYFIQELSGYKERQKFK